MLSAAAAARRNHLTNSCRVKLLKIGCTLMLAALVALTVAFMFDYVSEDDCNEYASDSTCSAFSDKCEW